MMWVCPIRLGIQPASVYEKRQTTTSIPPKRLFPQTTRIPTRSNLTASYTLAQAMEFPFLSPPQQTSNALADQLRLGLPTRRRKPTKPLNFLFS